MARNAHTFAIEDNLGISENLDAYAQVLAGMDEALGAALRPYLASIAAGHSVDMAAIWGALYAATGSADSDRADGTAGGAA